MGENIKKFKMIRIHITVILVIFITSCSPKHPSNTELIAFFRQNRSNFETLLQMFIEDKNLYVIGWYNDGTSYSELYDKDKSTITRRQENEYLNGLKKLNLINMGTWWRDKRGNKTAVFFSASGRGGALGGSIKRFIWFNKKVVESDVERKNIFIADFIPIDDHWYLLFEFHS